MDLSSIMFGSLDFDTTARSGAVSIQVYRIGYCPASSRPSLRRYAPCCANEPVCEERSNMHGRGTPVSWHARAVTPGGPDMITRDPLKMLTPAMFSRSFEHIGDALGRATQQLTGSSHHGPSPGLVAAVDDAASEFGAVTDVLRRIGSDLDVIRYGPNRGMSGAEVVSLLDHAAANARIGASLLGELGTGHLASPGARFAAIEPLSDAMAATLRGADFVERIPTTLRFEDEILRYASSMKRTEPYRNAQPWHEVLDKLDHRVRLGGTHEGGFRVPR